MKIYTPEISWHNREPVFSVDVQKRIEFNKDGTKYYRLVTCGSDNYVAIWRAYLNNPTKLDDQKTNQQQLPLNDIDKDVSDVMNSLLDQSVSNLDVDILSAKVNKEDNKVINVEQSKTKPKDKKLIDLECVCTLSLHEKATNMAKFAPISNLLASSSDDAVVYIWELKGINDLSNISEKDQLNPCNEFDEIQVESWKYIKSLRRHINDVVDLDWSPDEKYLITGSVDNKSYVWDIKKGDLLYELSNHAGYVQGVAWDPLNNFIATLCTDRYLRIFSTTSKKRQPIVKLNKFKLNSECPESKNSLMFYDDTLATISRRMNFSPNGELLACPSGIVELDDDNSDDSSINCLHMFYRKDNFKKVHCYFPTGTYTNSIRFCNKLFKLNPDLPNPYPFSYRLVFAVAAKDKILIYDTQQQYPIAEIMDIHYTRLSDLSWSIDGQILVATSTDGFCTLIYFTENELGEQYEGEPYKFETVEANTKTTANVSAKKAVKEKVEKKTAETVTKENQSAERTPSIFKFFQKKIPTNTPTPLCPTKLENSFQKVSNSNTTDECEIIKELKKTNEDEQNKQPQIRSTTAEEQQMIVDKPLDNKVVRRIVPITIKSSIQTFSQKNNDAKQEMNNENSKSNNNNNSLQLPQKRNAVQNSEQENQSKKKKVSLITLS